MTSAAHGGDDHMSDVPALQVERLGDVLTMSALAGLDGDILLRYLNRQRWFGARNGAASARVVDVVPLPWDALTLGIAIVEVQLANRIARYQVALAVRPIDAAPGANDRRTVVARVQATEGTALLVDALHDAAFQKSLGSALRAATTFDAENGGRWSITPLGEVPIVIRPDAPVIVGSAEQSNSALIVDQRIFLKVFRRLEVGVQPDVEMTRFLTADAAFPHVPPLLGTISYQDKGGDSIAGMFQGYLAGSRDAWSYVLETSQSGSTPAGMDDIAAIGSITRELHDVLAGAPASNAAFAPVRAGAGDVEKWAQRTKETIREATTLLDRQRAAGKFSPERAAEAEVLVRRRDHYLAWIEEVADLVGDDGGAKIRIHGDYHLGQVLRTKNDSFAIIDFEGEPTRSIADRREKASALRDVAGMLRSLAYAAAMLVKSGNGSAKSKSVSQAERELIAGRWERDARAAFLRGYTGTMQDQRRLLPSDPKHFDALLSLFEAEKSFYELAYELNHRPGWEWIPMRGISRLLVK